MSAGTVRLEKNGRSARIILDRPLKRNAMTTPMTNELFAALAELEQDAGVAVVVLTGEGSAFCGGRDMNELRQEFGDSDHEASGSMVGAPVARRIAALPQIVITMINGAAVGEGIDLALSGDFAIASGAAVLADYHMVQGIVPSAGCWTLPRTIGEKRAFEMLLLGMELTGTQAAEMGLVNRAVPLPELEGTVQSYVDRLLERSLESARYTKRAVKMGRTASFEHTMEFVSFARAVAAKSRSVDDFTMKYMSS